MSEASAAWDAWLAECLGGLSIDADVFGPYVTGIMVRRARWRRCLWLRVWGRGRGMGRCLSAACAHPRARLILRVQEDASQPEEERAQSVVRHTRLLRRAEPQFWAAVDPPVRVDPRA